MPVFCVMLSRFLMKLQYIPIIFCSFLPAFHSTLKIIFIVFENQMHDQEPTKAFAGLLNV